MSESKPDQAPAGGTGSRPPPPWVDAAVGVVLALLGVIGCIVAAVIGDAALATAVVTLVGGIATAYFAASRR